MIKGRPLEIAHTDEGKKLHNFICSFAKFIDNKAKYLLYRYRRYIIYKLKSLPQDPYIENVRKDLIKLFKQYKQIKEKILEVSLEEKSTQCDKKIRKLKKELKALKEEAIFCKGNHAIKTYGGFKHYFWEDKKDIRKRKKSGAKPSEKTLAKRKEGYCSFNIRLSEYLDAILKRHKFRYKDYGFLDLIKKYKNEGYSIGSIKSYELENVNTSIKNWCVPDKNGNVRGFPKPKKYINSFQWQIKKEDCNILDFNPIQKDGKKYILIGSPFKEIKILEDISDLYEVNVKLRGKRWTFSHKAGRYWLSINYEENGKNVPAPNDIVVIDTGIRNLGTTYNGNQTTFLNLSEEHEKKINNLRFGINKLKSRLSKKESLNNIRSKRWIKDFKRKQHLELEIEQLLDNWFQETTTKVVRNYETIILEWNDIENMVLSASGTLNNPGKNVAQKSGLTKSILESRMGSWKVLLKYKCEEYNRTLIFVYPNKSFAPSQECSNCGHKNEYMTDGREEFSCEKCDHIDQRDKNACKTIYNVYTSKNKDLTKHFEYITIKKSDQE